MTINERLIMINVTIFSIIIFSILTGYLIGFVITYLSSSKIIKDSFKLIDDYKLATQEHFKIISSLTGKIFYQDETIETLIKKCNDQSDAIDDLTAQIAEMHIIRLDITSKILDKNIESNKGFLDGIGKN